MSWIPFLNDEPYSFTPSDLPALIHGERHSGSSLFSLTMLSHFVFQGDPVLFISASTPNKDELSSIISEKATLVTVNSQADFAQAEESQVIFLSHENESLLPSLLDRLEDRDERVVLLNTIETLSPTTLKSFYTHPQTIFSGDLNTCSEKEPLLQLKYNAKIFFSPLTNDLRLTLPPLEQYHGYYQGRISQGTVYLKETPTQ